jgi:hypothetical protein
LAQIELGVKRVSLSVRSIVQLHEPAEIDGTRIQYSTQAARYRSKPNVALKREALRIFSAARKKNDTQKLKLS